MARPGAGEGEYEGADGCARVQSREEKSGLPHYEEKFRLKATSSWGDSTFTFTLRIQPKLGPREISIQHAGVTKNAGGDEILQRSYALGSKISMKAPLLTLGSRVTVVVHWGMFVSDFTIETQSYHHLCQHDR